jgi:hypothetical protein
MDARRAMFAACKRLGFDDDARHAMLHAITGKASSKDLTPADWRAVLNHLNKLTGEDEWHWVNDAPEAKRPALWKIRRLVLEIGIQRGGQVAYAEGVAKRISGHERHLRMMRADELQMLIGPLTRTLNSKRNHIADAGNMVEVVD